MDNTFIDPYNPGDIVTTKKPHPCGENKWRIIRTGADIKLKCEKCGRIVTMERAEFQKRVRRVISRAAETGGAADE